METETLCNIIKKNRKYSRTNRAYKTLTTRIEQENAQCVSCFVKVSYNIQTEHVNVVSGLRYMKKSVYPEKFSHLNCHDENVKDRYHKYNQASSKKIKSRCFTESIEVADGYFLSIMANIRINTSSGTVSIQNVFCFKGKQIKFG